MNDRRCIECRDIKPIYEFDNFKKDPTCRDCINQRYDFDKLREKEERYKLSYHDLYEDTSRDYQLMLDYIRKKRRELNYWILNN